MSRAIITVGALTTHGGKVVTGSPASVINGIPMARVGDSVICPLHGHVGVTIATGDPTFIVDGKPVARHGDKTTCGATLIATQQLCVIEEGGAPVQTSPAVPLLDLSEPPVNFEEEACFITYQLKDEDVILSEYSYELVFTDGTKLKGQTDQEGRTEEFCSSKEVQDVFLEIKRGI